MHRIVVFYIETVFVNESNLFQNISTNLWLSVIIRLTLAEPVICPSILNPMMLQQIY